MIQPVWTTIAVIFSINSKYSRRIYDMFVGLCVSKLLNNLNIAKMADYGKLDIDYLQKENRKLRIELK